MAIMDAIVLAGQDERPQRGKEANLLHKEIGGKESYLTGSYKPLLLLEDLKGNRAYLIERVLDALIGSELVGRVVVVGRKPLWDFLKESNYDVVFVEQGENVAENIQLGLEALKHRGLEYVLTLASDLPHLTPQTIDDMLAFSIPQLEHAKLKPGVVFSFVDKAIVDPYPRRYFPVWDNLFSNPPVRRRMKEANYLFVSPMANFEMLGRFYSMRKMCQPKNWLKLLGMLGTIIPGYFGMSIVPAVGELLIHRGISLRRFNKGFCKLLGEEKKNGSYPVVFTESKWQPFSLDVDSEEDVARLGFTLAGEGFYEHKTLLQPKPHRLPQFFDLYSPFGGWREFYSTEEAKELGFKKAMLVEHYENPNQYFFVTRWETQQGFMEYFERHRAEHKKLFRRTRELTEFMEQLGWYGGP